jgi:Zn finger protein HypA/HybF involved in hydrogenase expression
MNTAIVERLIAEAKKQGRVKSMLVEVGELTTAFPHMIKAALEQKMGCTVAVLQKQGIVQFMCGYFGEPKILEKTENTLEFVCPSCGNAPGVVDGERIFLKEVVLA